MSRRHLTATPPMSESEGSLHWTGTSLPTSCAAEWSPIITEGHAFDMGAQLCIGHSASTAAFISSRMRTKARGLAFHHDRPAPHLRPDWIERCDDLNFLGPFPVAASTTSTDTPPNFARREGRMSMRERSPNGYLHGSGNRGSSLKSRCRSWKVWPGNNTHGLCA